MLSFDQLGADAVRQIGAEKCPHLIAEGELFGGEAEIHEAKLLTLRHPRESGGPGRPLSTVALGSRFRGNDEGRR